MTFEIIKGDLFDPAHRFDALAQGVNCIGIMGAGIAVPFKTKFPLMYAEYLDLCVKNPRSTLAGHAQFSIADSSEHYSAGGTSPVPDVVNLFTQVFPGANADYALVERAAFAMDQAITTIDAVLQSTFGPTSVGTYRVGLPWVGCGIGGLDRHNVEHILAQTLGSSYVEYVLVEQ